MSWHPVEKADLRSRKSVFTLSSATGDILRDTAVIGAIPVIKVL